MKAAHLGLGVALILALTLGGGCAWHSHPYWSKSVDDFTGARTDTLRVNPVGGNAASPTVHLGVQRTQTTDGSVSFAWVVRYTGNNWLFIQPGKSLVLSVDAHRLAFKRSGTHETRPSFGPNNELAVEEKALYPASVSELWTVARAHHVQMLLIGRRPIQRELTLENLRRIREFMERFAPKQ